MGTHAGLVRAAFALALVLFSGCDLFKFNKSPETRYSQVDAAAVTDLAAFQGTVYKLSVTHCAGCHSVAQIPFHASQDVTTAYNAALPYVNFSNPASSVLAVRAGNGHCGSSACMGHSDEFAKAIQAWKDQTAISSKAPILRGYSQDPLVATRGVAIVTDSAVFTGTPLQFGITPDLPAGLSFNPLTGGITGTASGLALTATYTITASNSAGTSSMTLDITVNDVAPSNLTYLVNPLVATRTVVLTPNTPTSMGGPVVSYAVNPALPAGLTLDAVTGAISGAPAAIQAAAAYTITATNSGGSASAVVNITVNDVAPMMLQFATNPLVATKGGAVSDAASALGGPVVTYSVAPALPTGLTINAATGVVSGTPSAISPIAPYTVTAKNSGGATTVALNIQVNDVAPSNLVYSTNPLVATVGTAIAANTPTSAGGPVVSYSVAPALPGGLVLNATTGVISGTPTAITPTGTFTVTATNTGGSTTRALTITVNDVAPSALAYAQMAIVASKGTAITPDLPTSKGGAINSYSVVPALPAGITLNPTNGTISGVPTTPTTLATYTITGKNTGGSTSVAITVTVNDVAPSNLTYSVNPLIATKGALITPDTATLAGGAAATFAVNPALPTGLALNSTTGAISGTPTVVSALAAYTVTATTSGGSTTATLNIQVKDVTPSNLVYSKNPLTAILGTAITADTPTSQGGAVVSYSVNPPLPAGLVLNSATGVITGAGTAITAQANYTITATNSGGSATVVLPVAVNDKAPATLVYATNPLAATKGSAITPDLATVTGGAATAYAVTPALPAGLVLNTSTGAISGVPTVVAANATYTVTASNVTGAATVALKIAVNDVAPSALAYSANPLNATFGKAISPDMPTSMGGAVTSYTVAPALPAGLNLSATTGVISGAPTALAVTANYVVTAANSGGSTTVTLPVTVIDVPPVALSYSQPTVTYITGVAITANTPSNSGGSITSYMAGSALPTGLSLNSTTGVISGTPTAAAATGSYTIAGRNSGGTATTNVSITVVTPNPANPNATWNYINTTVLPKCTACHNATAPSNVVNFTTYAGVLTQLVPTKPLNSNFYTYVAPGSVTPMPLGGTPLGATDMQAIFDWIYIGAPGPDPTPSPTPSPSVSPSPNPSPSPTPSPSPDPTITNSSIPGTGSTFVPTTQAVVMRILKVLGPAGVTSATTNFAAALGRVKTSLPNASSPVIATGYDQIPLLIYSACSDANPTFFAVNTGGTVTAQTPNLINAGIAMVNAHVGNLAATGTTLNTQVAAIFQTLVTNDAAAGATTKMTFVSVCMTANTFGVEMTGF